MAGALTGDFADAKIIHPIDTEDGDDVGPGAYTLKNGATIQGTAKFGSALLADANFERLDSDVAVANFDQSDTAKTMYHFWWRTPTLAGNQGQVTWINSAGTQFKTRGKHPRLCTVTDIPKTYNSAGELVETSYVATHDFAGQVVTETGICAATISMGVV